MASGSGGDGPAYADRLREKYAKHNRMTQRALDEARTPVGAPGTEPYRAEMDSVSEVTLGKEGIKVRSHSPWLTLGIGILLLAAFVAWLRWH